jgi:hypothetical protein
MRVSLSRARMICVVCECVYIRCHPNVVPFGAFWGKLVKNSISLSSLLFCFKTQRKRTQTRIKTHTDALPTTTSFLDTMGSLFQVYNSFHLGAYQVAINEASDLLDLSPSESVEKDCYVYRSYIALGSYQVRLFSRVVGFFQTTRSILFLGASFFLRVVFGGVSAVVLSRCGRLNVRGSRGKLEE